MKVLLIGGTGVLSNEIMNLSTSLGHDVYVMNRGNRKERIPNSVCLLQANINDHEQVKSLITGIYFDVIIDFLCYQKNDIDSRLPIFARSCNQYIFISTAAVYDVRKNLETYTEESPLSNPLWKYSVDKVACENTVDSLCKKYGIHYTIIRPGVTYDNTRIPYGIMPAYGYHWTLAARILNNKPVLLWDKGKNITTITRVEDFAKGAVGLFGNEKAYNEAFNVTGDESHSWLEVINTLGDVLGKKPITLSVPKEFLAQEMPTKKGEILGGRGYDLVCSNSKLKNVVHDFETTVSLKEGLEKTAHYYQENHYLIGIDYVFDAMLDRIIRNYNKETDKKNLDELNINYIDYLSQKNTGNRLYYLTTKYLGPTSIQTLNKLKRLVKIAYRFIHKSPRSRCPHTPRKTA